MEEGLYQYGASKVEPSVSPNDDMPLSCTNLSGERMCHLLMSPSGSVANVRSVIMETFRVT